jgi:hypothetical protein
MRAIWCLQSKFSSLTDARDSPNTRASVCNKVSKRSIQHLECFGGL